MSVASSAASLRFVQFDGREISLEQALDEVIRGTQNKLNQLQCNLRQLAAAEGGEQAFGETKLEDFQYCVNLEDECCDLVAGLCELLVELPEIARDIAGKPEDAESKAWWKQHKLERKLALAKKKEEPRAKMAASKEARSQAAAAREESKEQ